MAPSGLLNGIVARRAVEASPIAVQYRVTASGKSLKKPLKALCEWTVVDLLDVEEARQTFDKKLVR